LARKYRVQDNGLQDEGLRVLADEQIAYEADAILLVEREGDERTITPIIKPPRPAHLKLNKRYAATLATLYPDLVPDAERTKGRKGTGAAERQDTAERQAPVAARQEEDDEAPVAAPAPAPAAAPAAPPRDPAEAEQRFFTRYGEIIGGDSWDNVQSYLRSRAPKPTTIEGWIATAEAVRDRSRNDSSPAMAA
jgi:hypothetical protein